MEVKLFWKGLSIVNRTSPTPIPGMETTSRSHLNSKPQVIRTVWLLAMKVGLCASRTRVNRCERSEGVATLPRPRGRLAWLPEQVHPVPLVQCLAGHSELWFSACLLWACAVSATTPMTLYFDFLCGAQRDWELCTMGLDHLYPRARTHAWSGSEAKYRSPQRHQVSSWCHSCLDFCSFSGGKQGSPFWKS